MFLAIGAFNIEYIHDNWREPIKYIYGDYAITINALPLILYLGRVKTQSNIIELAKIHDVTTVLFYHDWIKGSFSEEFFEKLRSLGVRIAAFYPDDEPEQWFNDNLQYDHHYDVIGTHSAHGCALREKRRHQCEVLHLPWGFNPRKFFQRNVPKAFDLIFVGKHKSLKEDGLARLEFLEEIARLAKLKSWSFAVFGYGWANHPTLSQYWQGSVDSDRLPEVLCSAKVVLNPAWSSDSDNPLPQVKLRHFEVLGIQSIQLTNYNPELLKTLGKTNKVIYYERLNDLEFIISEALIRFGRSQSEPCDVAAHSIDTRIKTLVKYANSIEGHSVVKASEIRIAKVSINSSMKTSEFANKISLLAKSYDYLHFISDSIIDSFCDYTNYDLSTAQSGAAIKLNFTVNFSSFQKNHLHTDEVNNVYCEFFDQYRGYEYWHTKYPGLIENILHIIEVNGEKCPLEAFLIPASLTDNYIDWINKSLRIANHLIEFRPNRYGIEFTPSKQSVNISGFNDFTLASLSESIITTLIERLVELDITFGIYGARGYLSKILYKILAKKAIKPQLLIDNGIVGELVNSIEVKSHQDLKLNSPEIMLICAELSGPRIIQAIKNDEIDCIPLPLYDFDSAHWTAFEYQLI